MAVTLERAEQFFRTAADDPNGMDTGEAFRVLLAEYDRRGELLGEPHHGESLRGKADD